MSAKRLVYIAGLSSDPNIGSFIRQDMQNIKTVLENYENEGQIILRTDEFATKRAIINRFMDNTILPWLFYYSGHSDDQSISFSDSKLKADDFVNILDDDRIRESLQLIYLGSCNSLTIGQKLMDKKVKVVIASDDKVQAHLSNIVSQFFFNNLFSSRNIQEAYDRTEKLFMADRTDFEVNQTVDFPWHLLTSSETNLAKELKPIRLSSEQKHQLALNATNIRLELLNYYIQQDPSDKKKINLIKEEASAIQKGLDKSLDIIDEDKNIKTLIEPLIDVSSVEVLPDKDRIKRTNRVIKNLKMPDNFVRRTVEQVSTMRDFSADILKL